MTKYVIVTAISQFRQRYAIPVDELKKLNLEVQPTEEDLHEWARDCVTMGEVKEFSQHYLGEVIFDSHSIDQDNLIKQFDNDNHYLSSWPHHQKIKWIDNWKDNIHTITSDDDNEPQERHDEILAKSVK